MSGHGARRPRGVAREFGTQVRLDHGEREQLQQLAAQTGLSVPRLLVETTLGHYGDQSRIPRVLDAEALTAIHTATSELGRVGANLNQLTVLAHRQGGFLGGRLEADLDETLDAVRTAAVALETVAEEASE